MYLSTSPSLRRLLSSIPCHYREKRSLFVPIMTIDETLESRGGNRNQLTTLNTHPYEPHSSSVPAPLFNKADAMSALYSSSVTAKIWGVSLTQQDKVSIPRYLCNSTLTPNLVIASKRNARIHHARRYDLLLHRRKLLDVRLLSRVSLPALRTKSEMAKRR